MIGDSVGGGDTIIILIATRGMIGLMLSWIGHYGIQPTVILGIVLTTLILGTGHIIAHVLIIIILRLSQDTT